MPKLASKIANATESAEVVHGGGDFEPLPKGKYLAKLTEVSVRDEKNKYDAPQWSAEFQEIHTLDGEKQPGRQWLNLTLPTTSKMHPAYANGQEKWEKYQAMLLGRLKAFFEAFGYTPDSDTDEMLGEWAVITLSISTIQSGPNQGKLRNEVTDIEEVPEDFEAPEDSEYDENDAF